MGFSGPFFIPGHTGTDFKHRKAFSKQKKHLENRKLLKGVNYKNHKTEANKLESDAQNISHKNKGRSVLIFYKLLLVSISISISFLGYNTYKKYSSEFAHRRSEGINQSINAYQKKEADKAYNFLSESGDIYLQRNQLGKAQMEFMRALKVNEYGQDARIGLTKVLIKKCGTHGTLCKQANANIKFLLEMNYASEKEILNWKNIK